MRDLSGQVIDVPAGKSASGSSVRRAGSCGSGARRSGAQPAGRRGVSVITSANIAPNHRQVWALPISQHQPR
jgi:hypothetical protein